MAESLCYHLHSRRSSFIAMSQPNRGGLDRGLPWKSCSNVQPVKRYYKSDFCIGSRLGRSGIPFLVAACRPQFKRDDNTLFCKLVRECAVIEMRWEQ